jgi:hypothetical protein
VDPVPGPVLLRKPGSAGNRTRDLRICSQNVFWDVTVEYLKWVDISEKTSFYDLHSKYFFVITTLIDSPDLYSGGIQLESRCGTDILAEAIRGFSQSKQ